jgi:hypothetical protein
MADRAEILEGLNDAQTDAVTACPTVPLLIIAGLCRCLRLRLQKKNRTGSCQIDKISRISFVAGAGSGKTRTLVCRIANAITNGASPQAILCLTFTRTAATEAKDRLSQYCGPLAAAGVTVCTFHSFCLRILRRCGHRRELHIATAHVILYRPRFRDSNSRRAAATTDTSGPPAWVIHPTSRFAHRRSRRT